MRFCREAFVSHFYYSVFKEREMMVKGLCMEEDAGVSEELSTSVSAEM